MASVETPYGRLQWEGELLESSTVTVIREHNGSPQATEVRLSTLIAQTNGGILPFLPPPGQSSVPGL